MNNDLQLGGLGSLSALLDQGQSSGEEADRLLELSIDLIDEDPEQPRKEGNPGFDQIALEELAATIASRGVKTPISVRNHPTISGRYMINHGERRFRASKIAGKTTIPAILDNDHTKSDQVIENLHRSSLTAKEIAEHIDQELKKGKKKGDIAKELGKSPAFISQHVALLNLPEPIKVAFDSGQIKDVTVASEMTKLYGRDPNAVVEFLSFNDEITRPIVKEIVSFIDTNEKKKAQIKPLSPPPSTGGDDSQEKNTNTGDKNDPTKLKKAIVQVEYDGRLARLLQTRRPTAHGLGWIKYDDDGEELEVNLASLVIKSLLEG